MRHPPVPRLSCHSLLNHHRGKTSLFVVACCCRLLGFVYIGGWTWAFFLDISFEYFLSFLLVYIKKLYGFAKGCEIGSMFFLSVVDRDTHPT